MKKFRSLLLAIMVLPLLLASCVSNKKHLAAVDTLQVNHQSEVDQWRTQVNAAKYEMDKLKLQLAERKGENNILVSNADKLETQVEALESQIENMATQSSTSQQGLNQQLQQKDQSISNLKSQLQSVSTVLDRHQGIFDQLMQEMRDSMRYWTTISYSFKAGAERASVIFPESLVFKKNSVTKMEDNGYGALSKIAQIFKRYPNMQVTIITHTDNSVPKNKSYKDNWNFCLLQAATIVRTMTQDFGISAGQLLPGGKAEFVPRASNEDATGRNLNRRIEFALQPISQDLIKAVRAKL